MVRVLNRVKQQRGLPKFLFCDNGSEFTSQAMDLCPIFNFAAISITDCRRDLAPSRSRFRWDFAVSTLKDELRLGMRREITELVLESLGRYISSVVEHISGALEFSVRRE